MGETDRLCKPSDSRIGDLSHAGHQFTQQVFQEFVLKTFRIVYSHTAFTTRAQKLHSTFVTNGKHYEILKNGGYCKVSELDFIKSAMCRKITARLSWVHYKSNCPFVVANGMSNIPLLREMFNLFWFPILIFFISFSDEFVFPQLMQSSDHS